MGVRRCDACVIEAKLTGDPATIEMVRQAHEKQKHDGNDRQCHIVIVPFQTQLRPG
jgi:hypothetical protein